MGALKGQIGLSDIPSLMSESTSDLYTYME